MNRQGFFVGLIVWLVPGLTTVTFAQTTVVLTGYVTDATTGKAMPFANVYLNGSTRGTLTNEQGHYTLTGVPLGTVEVVASFVGYQLQKHTLRLDDGQEKRLNFRLKPGDKMLDAVTVRANPKKWQQHLKQFKRQLLGEPFGGQCQVMNPDVLSFHEEKGHLTATATEPLLIENQALGYRLWYDMLYFDGTVQKVFYSGSARFEEIKAADERQASRFQRNRMRAYKGSIRHLMASLVDSTYEREGFLVYQENLAIPINRIGETKTTLYGSINGRLQPLKIKKLIQPGRLGFERKLVSDRPLVVFYTNATSSYSPYTDARYAYSQIKLPTGQIQLTVDGTVTLPEGMEVQGSLADDRLSTLLPADWQPNSTNADPTLGLPVVAQGKLMPADARMGRITAKFAEQFKVLAPVLFVHTDKPLYATGDQLWLSAYLLDAATNRRPLGETAIHVDLITDAGRLVQHQWLRVTDGRATGNFRLSDSLTSGTYWLRGYTDEDDGQHRPAFERSVAVYNTLKGVEPTVVHAAPSPTDVQLLPEGGRWLEGVSSRLGIKAVGPDGHGVVLSGQVMDDKGTEISRFTTNPMGMGSVIMTPHKGQKYHAEWLDNGQRQRVPLPRADAEGFSLSTDVVSDTTRLLLTITGTNRPASDSVYVLIQQQGRVVDGLKIRLEKGIARVSLPTATLPPGLNQITLYDATARPQAERLVFLPERMSPIRVILGLNKSHYQPRESAILSVNLNDDGLPAVAALSTSVTDAGQVPDDTAAATIHAHLLLTGELRGRVEHPAYYFQNTLPSTRRAVDDLLLTQGWRRVSGTPDTELLGGVSLMGQVLDAKNQPMAGAQVMIASMTSEPSFVKSAGTDERGWFRLAGLAIADTVRVVTQLADHQLKPFENNEAHLVLGGPGQSWDVDTTAKVSNWQVLRAQLDAARVRQEENAAFYRDKTAKVLKEVTVRARKIDERPEDVRRRSLHSGADATLVFDERSPKFANLYEMMRGRFAGVSVQQLPSMNYSVIIRGAGSLIGSLQPLYLMDGVPFQDPDGTALLAFSPEDVERVELLKNASTSGIYGVRAGSGVIAFYSKVFRPDQAATKKTGGAKPMQLIGYSSVQREFYVPRYDYKPNETQPELSSRIDRRDVLYWKPLIQTDSQGHSQLIFPLSDVVRTVRVVVQGVSADGRPVVGVGLFQVQ